MTPKKLAVFAVALIVLGLIIFQVTRSPSPAAAENNPGREPSKDTATTTDADKSSGTNSGTPTIKSNEAAPPDQPVTAEDLNKVTILKQILQTKNDNDPRLDSEFKNLSENAKKLMRAEYKTLQPEKFNEKGTVVFLLGRNLKSKEDFDFMTEVLSEPPCLNMSDCSAPAPEPAKGDAAHEDSITGVTLSYPQIVTLKAVESFLTASDNSKGRSPLMISWPNRPWTPGLSLQIQRSLKWPEK